MSSIDRFNSKQFVGEFFDFFRSSFEHMQGKDDSGLVKIELFKNFSVVSKLWSEFALTISLRVRVQGSRLIPSVDYTPYLYALDHGRKDLISFIAQHEAGFTKRFIAMKCDALHRYEIEGDYKVDGVSFGPGVDHVTHHDYLIPHLCRSWEAFFKGFVEEPLWDTTCSKELLRVVNDTHCTSCSEDFKDLTLLELQEKWGERMILFSDSASNICNRSHWISFVLSQDQIAIGNRGQGAGRYPGVRVYRLTDEMKTFSIEKLIDFFQARRPTAYLPLVPQWSGSCSRTSFEAAFLGGIYLILQKKHPALGSSALAVKANGIWEAWLKFDRTVGLKGIMEKDTEMGYDPHLLIRVLAVFQDCAETAEAFYRSLREEKQINWSVFNETVDGYEGLPAHYAMQRNSALGRKWFCEEIERLEKKSREQKQTVWQEICNYRAIQPSVEESLHVLSNASIERIRRFIKQVDPLLSTRESRRLRRQYLNLDLSDAKFAKAYCKTVVEADKKRWGEFCCLIIACVCSEMLFEDFPERTEALRSMGAKLIQLYIDSEYLELTKRQKMLPSGRAFQYPEEAGIILARIGCAFAKGAFFDQALEIAIICAKRISKSSVSAAGIGAIGVALAETQGASKQALQIDQLISEICGQTANQEDLQIWLEVLALMASKADSDLGSDIALQALAGIPRTTADIPGSIQNQILYLCNPKPYGYL